MENEIGNQRKIVSKIFVIVIALAMIVPIGLMITVGESTETPMTRQAPVVDNFYAGNTQIKLAATAFDVNVGPQDLPDELLIDKYTAKVDGYYIVQFSGAVKQMWKAEIHQLGALIGDYVPYNAFMVRMSDEAKAQIEKLDFVQYVGIYQPAYKISRPLLTDMTLRSDLIVEDALAFINWENLWQKAKVIGQGQKTAVSIQVHEYENPYNVAALIAKAGGTLLSVSESGKSVRAVVSADGIQVLSFLNEVQYIQPWYQQEMLLVQANNYEQNKTGVPTTWQPVWDAGIHGEGVIVATSDTGLDTDHVMFFDPAWPGAPDWTGASPTHRKVVRYEQWTDDIIDDAASQHGTRTAGYACGDGDYVGNSNPNRFGMAYKAKISFHDIGGTADTLSGIPADLRDMFQIQFDDGARLSSNSWGVSVGRDTTGDGNDDTRTFSEGTYSADSMNSDWFMWTNKEFLIFFSAGNDRNRPVWNGGPYNSTVTPPSTGKNMICVAAHSAGAGWNVMELYSSWGPTRGPDWSAIDGEGRLKPDLASSAPATSAFGDHNRDGNQDSAYQIMAGTSTSGPIAMGGGALVHQYYLDGYWPTGTEVWQNGFEPSAALVKASMINGARWGSGVNANQHDYNLNGHFMDYPNNDQGWGMTDLGDSLYFNTAADIDVREMEVDDNTVGLITGQFREYEFYVEDSSDPLEISLVWTDYRGTQATCGALVNDLDLTVTDVVGGNTYWGNNYGNTITGWTRQSDPINRIGGYDHINNVECALILNPTVGLWKIRIDATNIPVGPQPYALVITGDLDQGWGWVKMDKSVYAKGDTVKLEIKDSNTGGPLDVVLVSSTGDTETVTLNQVGLNGRIFTGSINAVIDDIAVDGQITIENGGWILASYADASPSHISYANATTDLTGPEITGVYASDITNTAAVIYWTTDVPATSQVYYGTTSALGSSTTLDPDMVMGGAYPHKVPITGLNAFTDYYYDVESTSIGGVTTRDTNGGTHYMFTTVDNPDVLIVQEHSDVESSAKQVDDWELSLEEFGWSFVVWETVLYGLPSVAALNSAKLVYWDVGEGYPQLGSDERAIIQTWVNQPTQQLWYQTGQDVCWDMSDDGMDGPGTDVDNAWRQTYLQTNYRWDDADSGGGNEVGDFEIRGTTHPISSTFPGNGVGQDLEQDIYGPTRFWPDDLMNDLGGMNPPPWDYSVHHTPSAGNAGGIAYNVANYKLAYEAFAHAQIQDDGTYGTPGNIFGKDLNMDRATIADYTLQWLFGEDHPDVHVDAPNSGTYSGTSVPITWTVANAITISIQISQDGGQSYEIVDQNLPTAPATWNWDTTTTGVYGPGRDFPNGEHYRVKVVGYGNNLKGFDISDNNFTIYNGPGGDDLGPVIWAGSVKPSPIPVERGKMLHVTARADDSNKGNSIIFHVEYYIDGTTAPFLIGDMDPTDGDFNSSLEDAEIDYNTASLSVGVHTLNVRAQDFASNWGGFESIDFDVILGENTAPTIEVIAPDGGEVWMGGSVKTITWTMSDLQDPNSALVVDLYYTNDGGGLWNTIILGLTGVETYDWNPVPSDNSPNCLVRATVTDTGALLYVNTSDATFEIDSKAPAPATNVRAELTGTHVTVSWTQSVDHSGGDNDVVRYEIYYILNNWDPTGDSYNFLVDKGLLTSHVASNVGINNPQSYCWQVRTFDKAGHETRTITQAAKTGSMQSVFANPTGWFMLGSHLKQSSTLIDDVIRGAGLPASWDYAQVYDAVNNEWESHLKYRPDSQNDLTDITNEQGFWLHLTGSTRFATAGYVEDMSIPLEAGWNLIPYPFANRTTSSANIMTHLSTYCPNYDGMEILDPTAPYRLKTPDGTEILAHGMGFWVKVTADTTWIVTNYY